MKNNDNVCFIKTTKAYSFLIYDSDDKDEYKDTKRRVIKRKLKFKDYENF